MNIDRNETNLIAFHCTILLKNIELAKYTLLTYSKYGSNFRICDFIGRLNIHIPNEAE
jgi:hypothetical protein